MAIDLKYGKVTVERGLEDSGDEPVFVLRASDVLAIETLSHYRKRAGEFGCSFEFVRSVGGARDVFVAWQGTRKLPD